MSRVAVAAGIVGLLLFVEPPLDGLAGYLLFQEGHRLVGTIVFSVNAVKEEAAIGDREAYGRFLQLQRDFHQIMAGNDGNGKQGNGYGQPFPSRFVSEDPVPKLAAPAAEARGEPGSITFDGQEYAAGSV